MAQSNDQFSHDTRICTSRGLQITGKGEYEKVEHRGCNLRAADGKTVQENCESREGPEGKSRQYSRLVLVNDRLRFHSKVDTTVRKVNGRKSMEHCLARMHALLLTKLQQNTDDDRDSDRGGSCCTALSAGNVRFCGPTRQHARSN